MKHQLTKLVVSTLAISLIAITAHAQAVVCSNATLHGSYAFRVSGLVFNPAGLEQRDGVAMTHFDGNGGHDGETGNYTVNPDCTGNATINFPVPKGGTTGAVITLMFVIGDEGRTLHTIVSSLTPPNTSLQMPANIHSDAVKVGD